MDGKDLWGRPNSLFQNAAFGLVPTEILVAKRFATQTS